MTQTESYSRGAEWRQWDLHIHTPASFHWKGEKFDRGRQSQKNTLLVDEMICALNDAKPAVFALMDYWTFDGWFALKRRLKEPGAPALKKVVFPGIELRLAAPMKARLNAHVLFSDLVSDQTLIDFRSKLELEVLKKPLSDAAIIDLARERGRGDKGGSDEDLLFLHGASIAEIGCESYKDAIKSVPLGQAVGFMPYDTSDGLGEIDWSKHYGYFLDLFTNSPIFESRKAVTRDLFLNLRTEVNEKHIEAFQKALRNTPRLVVSGSDAHCFRGVHGDNDKRGYGDFPSGKATWIKADPTFRGLLQAIMEPAKRSFIGDRPPKPNEVDLNCSFFIDRLSIARGSGATCDPWFDGARLELNSDLVAIIGNKGSGKSALADILALLGNSQTKNFSFLREGRFKGSSSLAKNFEATLSWRDNTTYSRALHEDTPQDAMELVRYIPQGHFEALCSDTSENSDAFEAELQAVIFSHMDDNTRAEALDFGQLVEQQERGIRNALSEARRELTLLNLEIEECEDQLQPQLIAKFEAVRDAFLQRIASHEIQKPREPELPPRVESPAVKALEEVAGSLEKLELNVTANRSRAATLAREKRAVQTLRDQLVALERSYTTFVETSADGFKAVGLVHTDIVTFTVNQELLSQRSVTIGNEQQTLKVSDDANAKEKDELLLQQQSLKGKLDRPEAQYRQELKAMAEWREKLAELNGTPTTPDTFEGIVARLANIAAMPAVLDAKRRRRLVLAHEIFDTLSKQRVARERLYAPLEQAIKNDLLIRDEYPIRFQVILVFDNELPSRLFSLIKHNAGDFKSEVENTGIVRELAAENLQEFASVEKFLTSLLDKMGGGVGSKTVGIRAALRKDVRPVEVYDLLFGLSYLEPRYTLQFQGAQLRQLSAGQRGALLLIFYLLVDKSRRPIILDQPEENLDNETIVKLLVPILTKAKEKRQIIIVTHNPNLAVVCDAEQLVCATYDRAPESKISYVTGSIENPTINSQVVNVLEGTRPAFDNRRIKYQ